MNLYKKFTIISCSFLANDTTLVSNNLFRKNLPEKIKKLIMTIHDKIRAEKPQCDINSEATKISPLSSSKFYEYE